MRSHAQRFYQRTYEDRQLDLDERGNDFSKIRDLWTDNGRKRTVLDLGCGAGSVSAELVRRGHRVLGLDVLPEAVRRAAQRGLEARVGDVQDPLPFGDGSVDVVLALDIIEHVLDPSSLAAEIRRVLRPGGRLIASIPLHFDIVQRVRALLSGRIVSYEHQAYDPGLKSWDYYHVHFFTLGEAVEFVRGAGFRIEARIFRPLETAVLPRALRAVCPRGLLRWLAPRKPTLFASEVRLALRKEH